MAYARQITLFLIILAAAAMAGCSSYHVGPASPALAESIWIAPAVNDTDLPQFGTVLAEKVRESFLHDTQTRLMRQDDADVWLELTVKGLEREGRVRGVTVRQAKETDGVKTVKEVEDTGLFKAYNIVIKVRAILTDKDNRILSDKEYEASTQALPTPYVMNSADDERLLMPILARELARQIHESVAQLWNESPRK
jgi:hypothetical protein